MKVIDLLNKIANGKQPKAFEHNEELYIWEDKDKWYLSEPLLNLFYIHNNILNDEIEIIKEPKQLEKIKWEEKESLAGSLSDKNKLDTLARRTEKLKSALNEIIEKLEENK